MSTGNLAKTAATGGLVIAACAACCAPLVVPFVAPWVVAAVAGAGASLALIGQVSLALVIVAGAGVYLWFRRRTAQQALEAAMPAERTCGCGPEDGCNVGDACELPAAKAKPGLLERVRALC